MQHKTVKGEILLAIKVAREAHESFKGNDEEKAAARIMISILEAALNRITKFDTDAAINPGYAIEWAGELIEKIELADRVKRVLANWKGGADFKDALFAAVSGATEELVRNYHRGGSTSCYSNAVSHSKRAALASFVDTFKDLAERKELPQQ